MRLNDWGSIIRFAMVDCDGNAEDISAATTKIIRLQDPDGNFLYTGMQLSAATWYTDGTDGKLDYTIEDGKINKLGLWQGQAFVEGSNFSLSSEVISFMVRRTLTV
jgi:hypothetical protein